MIPIMSMKAFNMIFIVDDDPIHQQISQIMLERLGVTKQIMKFCDAEEVLTYLKQHLQDAAAMPDVILLDLNMPVMDGWDFLNEYATLYHQIPQKVRIYVLTSSIDEKDKERVGQYHFVNGYLTKPLAQGVMMKLLEEGQEQ